MSWRCLLRCIRHFWYEAAEERRAEHVRSARDVNLFRYRDGVIHSMPRYLTVLSILVWPTSSVNLGCRWPIGLRSPGCNLNAKGMWIWIGRCCSFRRSVSWRVCAWRSPGRTRLVISLCFSPQQQRFPARKLSADLCSAAIPLLGTPGWRFPPGWSARRRKNRIAVRWRAG